MTSIVNLMQTLYPSRELIDGGDLAEHFIALAESSKIDAFDNTILDRYKAEPQFLERKMLKSILSVCDIDIQPELLNLYQQQMNAAGASQGSEQVIMIDELLSYSFISFVMTVFSLNNDTSSANFERCVKNFVVLLDLQGRRKEIGTHSVDDLEKLMLMPSNLIHLSMDTYWTAWTFVIGHELYHLTQHDDNDQMQEELNADRYGYQVLMKMIDAQRNGDIPDDLRAFYQELYLSPVMLFEYFKAVDWYCGLIGHERDYVDYPSPERRQEQIFDLFESEVPDWMDTEQGNELLNTFLDTVEILIEQVRIKYEMDKLDIILGE